jgi:hypothetical protein
VESILRDRSRELGLEIGMSQSRDLGRELSRGWRSAVIEE